MRCAALHRKLGTHITKVKSLSMDSWSNDQVDVRFNISYIYRSILSNAGQNMKRVGNIASNRVYNPKNTKPPIPIDADEADSAMERFIRQKYQERAVKAATRHNTAGSSDSDDQPPPLPPKTSSKFGFRSASSIFPLSSKSRREPPPPVHITHHRSPSPGRNKESSVFGASVGTDTDGYKHLDLAGKMSRLRDMGFMDDKRSLAVLNGLGGNLEKTIDTLVRLGEGTGNVASDASSSRSRTPMSPNFPSSAGLPVSRTRSPLASPAQKSSTNPFDMLDAPSPAQPQSSQSTGSKVQPQSQPAGNNPFHQATSSNPFGLMPSQSQYSLNQAFQNMAVSSSQPLFPNHTGGFPGPQQPQQQQLYQQSMTPPVPLIPQQYYPSVIYENPTQQPQQPQQNTSYNPFMQQHTQQVPPINTAFQNNPYAQQQQTPQSLYQSPVQQSPQQAQQQQQPGSAFYDNGGQQQSQMQAQQQPMQPAQQQFNPFFNQANTQQQPPQQLYNTQPQQQPQYQKYRQQTHPLMPQQTGKADKRSILDLYNYPQLAPTPLQQTMQPQQLQQSQQQEQAQDGNLSMLVLTASQPQSQSVSSPLSAQAGSRNPFAMTGGNGVQNPGGDTKGGMGQFAPNQNGTRHVSQESMSIDTGGWMNGRHSPDAFGTLSARSMR
jgi:hypothetical protein